jgi:hypothetical protein
MLGRLCLALFGMEPLTERCECCGRRRLRRTAVVAKRDDPVALFLDDQISVVELERRLRA